MDLSKLRLPWTMVQTTANVIGPDDETIAFCWINPRAVLPSTFEAYRARAEFIAVASRAFDVMMRRHWSPIYRPDGQWVVEEQDGSLHTQGTDGWPDPFTALLAVDRWMTEQGK